MIIESQLKAMSSNNLNFLIFTMTYNHINFIMIDFNHIIIFLYSLKQVSKYRMNDYQYYNILSKVCTKFLNFDYYFLIQLLMKSYMNPYIFTLIIN
jgi:hypothetical protein